MNYKTKEKRESKEFNKLLFKVRQGVQALKERERLSYMGVAQRLNISYATCWKLLNGFEDFSFFMLEYIEEELQNG